MSELEQSDHSDISVFGPFRLLRARRQLERAGKTISLNRPTMEILVALVDRSGKVVSNADLIAAAWGDNPVEDGSLRAGVAMLRKVLADGDPRARYIANVPGQGYCFVAPVRKAIGPKSGAGANPRPRLAELPARRQSIIGRGETVRAIAAQLEIYRFVTIVGAGGIGKSTVVVSVGHELAERFGDHIGFVDLGRVDDPGIVDSAIASVLGLKATSDPLESLIAFLRDKRFLLILDSCEHVIEPVSAISERIFAEATGVHLLATSREPLRVEGERLHQLPPLDFPDEEIGLSAGEALEYSAIRLFVDRATAAFDRFELSDADVPVVAEICRKLDGIALAIELAAGRVGAFGLQQISTLIDGRVKLLWAGRRNAPSRQRTLRATLEWSYDLLEEPEQVVLRRLSVFVGGFSLASARKVVADTDKDKRAISETLEGLVLKSLVNAKISEVSTCYWLLDMTRAFARQKLQEAKEEDIIARRHALECYEGIKSRSADKDEFLETFHLVDRSDGIVNIRAALQWCFSPRGDRLLGILLAVASPSQFLAVSLLRECAHWSEMAIAELDDTLRGTRTEMVLQGALGISYRWTHDERYREAFARSLEIAETIGESARQAHLLHHLRVIELASGNTQRALELARQTFDVAERGGNLVQIAVAEATLGISYQTVGAQADSCRFCQAALHHARLIPDEEDHDLNHHIFKQAEFSLSNGLWHIGCVDQALDLARLKIDEARTTENFMLWSEAILWCGNVHVWAGEWEELKACINRLMMLSNQYPTVISTPYIEALYAGAVLNSGGFDEGIARLERCIAMPIGTHASRLLCQMLLIPGLIEKGELVHALDLLNTALGAELGLGQSRWSPEVLRLKAQVLMRLKDSNLGAAEDICRKSIQLARDQTSLSWELRSTITLAKILNSQGDRDGALVTLEPVLAKFQEGFKTQNLLKARNLIERLQQI